MITGISTLPKAIVSPINNVPINKKLTPNKERTTIPMSKRRREKNIVRSIPIRREILGAIGDKKAKASNGNVVRSEERRVGKEGRGGRKRNDCRGNKVRNGQGQTRAAE